MGEPDLPTVLIDEQLYGLADYLRDRRWPHVKAEPGRKDDEVINQARANGYIVVTADRKVQERCRVAEIPCVSVNFAATARSVIHDLERLTASSRER